MCLNPKLIKRNGEYKEDNYRGKAGDKYSIKTFSDCGYCTQCIAKKANNWVIRNFYEAKEHEKKCFITLTYAKAPIFLVKKDLQDFVKRFRFEINAKYYAKLRIFKRKVKKDPFKKEKIETWKIEHEKNFIKTRIFYAGEYGTAKGRPHFHVIIYGWNDPKAYYIGINKKINIIYQSGLIERTWGLGRTSYQEFGDHEASYIALYSTAQEEFKRAYKLSMAKVKQIREFVEKKIDYYPKMQRVNLLNTLVEYEKEMISEKKTYMLIREFNGWSTALGWEGFIKEYMSQHENNFKVYIYDMEFATPSPWLKKLANKYGDIDAANELFKREAEQYKSATEEEEKGRNEARERNKRKKELLEWIKQDRKNGEIDEF